MQSASSNHSSDIKVVDQFKVVLNDKIKKQIFQSKQVAGKRKVSSTLQIDMLLVCKIENEFGYPERFIVDCLR
jgi:hypothetical protein